MASGEYGTVNDCADYKNAELVTCMRVKILKWAGHVIRTFDNRMPKRILKGNVGGRKRIGNPRNRWSSDVQDTAISLIAKN
jgi:hypothetical protein